MQFPKSSWLPRVKTLSVGAQDPMQRCLAGALALEPVVGRVLVVAQKH